VVTLDVQVVGAPLVALARRVRHGDPTRGWHVDQHKAERLEDERDEEREEGIAAHRRGSKPAPSDEPEGTAPHPQDVNEIGQPNS